MNADDEQVRARIGGRNAAETIAALAAEEALRLPAAGRQRFWEVLAAKLAAYLPKPQPTAQPTAPQPMSDRQARNFEQARMPFGKYEGERIGEVDLNYLIVLADPAPSDFIKNLRRYLASPAIHRELQ